MILETLVLLGQLDAAAAPRVLTLAEAIAHAEQHQPRMAKARATIAGAEARVGSALAPRLPQLGASATYTRQTGNFVLRPGALPSNLSSRQEPSFQTYGFFNFGLNASQLVWDFGQASGQYDAAKRTVEAEQQNAQATRNDVVFNVRNAYFTAWSQRALVDVARQNFEAQERHFQQVNGLVNAGARPSIDVFQVRSDRANARLSVVNAENAYATAKAQLAYAMGLDDGRPFDVADEALPAVEGEDANDGELVRLGMQNRPELRALDKQAEALRSQLSSARAEYAPSLSVTSGLTEAGPELGELTWNWNAAATISWNFFQGFATRSRVRQIEANQGSAEADRQTLAQQIRLELVQARLGVRAAKEAVTAAQEAEVNARERLRLAEGRYAAGAGSIVELQDAQLAATTTAADVVRSKYSVSVARAQLVKALGRP